MHKHKAVTLINYFTEEQQKKFALFLKSPYHNTRKKPVDLFKVILKYKKKILAGEMTTRNIFEKIYKGKEYNSSTLNDVMAQLYHLADEFLSVEVFLKDKLIKNICLVQQYAHEEYKELFESKRKQIDKVYSEEKELSLTYFFLFFWKNAEYANYYQHCYGTTNKKIALRLSEVSMDGVMALIQSCLLGVNAVYRSFETRPKKFMDEKHVHTLKQLTLHLYDNKFLDLFKTYNKWNYIIDIRKKDLEVLLDPLNKEKYFEYKSALKKHKKLLGPDENVIVYIGLIRHCMNKLSVNEKDPEFQKEFKEILYKAEENQFYHYSNTRYFHHALYSIFLRNFVKQKDIPTIQYMIKKFVPLLEEKFMESYKNLSYAYIYFFSNSFEKTLNLLTETKAHNVAEVFDTKKLLIQTHFHLGNTEQVLSLLETCSKLLKSPETIKERYLRRSNFIKYIRKIIFFMEKNKFQELKYLYELISNTEQVDEKDWLLEILGQYYDNKTSKNKKSD